MHDSIFTMDDSINLLIYNLINNQLSIIRISYIITCQHKIFKPLIHSFASINQP